MKVAASLQIYKGRCRKVVCKSLVMYTALKGFRVQGSGFRVSLWGDARKFAMAGFPRIASLPFEGKVPRRGG